MSEEAKIESTENAEVVAEPTVEEIKEVVEQMQVASLEFIKSLPALRKARGVPFQIPGTEMVVKICKPTGSESYQSIITQLRLAATQDEEERVAILRATANSMIKCCVVEPKLDDEAITALEEYDGDAFQALVERCGEVAADGKAVNTELMEAFSSGSLGSTS